MCVCTLRFTYTKRGRLYHYTFNLKLCFPEYTFWSVFGRVDQKKYLCEIWREVRHWPLISEGVTWLWQTHKDWKIPAYPQIPVLCVQVIFPAANQQSLSQLPNSRPKEFCVDFCITFHGSFSVADCMWFLRLIGQ